MPGWVKSSSYDSSCLVPYFDMLNNDSDICNSYSYNRREEQFEIRCKGFIEQNSQIFINYGTYGTADILLDYGYVNMNTGNTGIDELFVSATQIVEMYFKWTQTTTPDQIKAFEALVDKFENDEFWFTIYEHCIDSLLFQFVNFIQEETVIIISDIDIWRKGKYKNKSTRNQFIRHLLSSLIQIYKGLNIPLTL